MASIGNLLWNDLNRDGLQGEGEPGLAGVNVHLLSREGAVLQSRHSTVSGRYDFDGLSDGLYKVKIDRPNGFQFTTANAGENMDELDSNFYGIFGGYSSLIRIDEGVSDLTIDAGFVPVRRASRRHLMGRYWGHQSPFSRPGELSYGGWYHRRSHHGHCNHRTIAPRSTIPTADAAIVPLPSAGLMGAVLCAGLLVTRIIRGKLNK